MSTTGNHDGPFTDEKGAKVRTGLSERTLQKYRQTGAGPTYIKRGRRVFYAIADLDDWMAAGRRRSTSDPGEVAAS